MSDETTITGLPEGVKIVRLGLPRPGEFEHIVRLIAGREVGFIYQNRPGTPAPSTIVEPQEGYRMKMDTTTRTFVAEKIVATEAVPDSHTVKLGDTIAFGCVFEGQPAGTKFRLVDVDDPADLRGAQLVPVQ